MSIVHASSRADLYNAAFPKRPPLAYGNGMVTGTWMIGACYKNPNPLYGAYPYGYLERVHAMFPDAQNILHVFSGGLTHKDAVNALPVYSNDHDVALVDMKGPEEGRYPTHQCDVTDLPESWTSFWDLILADPPYSAEDAAKYDCPPPNRGRIMRALRRVCKHDGNLVWLDTCWPQHRKTDWKTWGTVGLVRSTMHRMRLVSMFEAQ